MAPADDEPTPGEIARTLARLEAQLGTLNESVTKRLDQMEGRMVNKDVWALEMARINDRFQTNEVRINDHLKAQDEDIDKLAGDLAGAVTTWKQDAAAKRERWWDVVKTGIVPGMATFFAGVGLTVLSLALDGKL